MFIKADDWLFDYMFEKFARWFQRLTGNTNFWLATVTGLMAFFFMWCLSTEHLRDGEVLVFILEGGVSLCGLLLVRPTVDEVKDEVDSRGEENQKYINRLRVTGRGIRVFWLCSCAGVLVLSSALFYLSGVRYLGHFVFWNLFMVCVISYHYFLACTPLPPGISKFRQWLNKLLWGIHNVLQPLPVFVPTTMKR